jgi:hypothetical protein
MKLWKWAIKKFFGNFGDYGTYQRSGQRGMIKLWLHYWLYPFKSVINLAWSPETDSQDMKESWFCTKRGIPYVHCRWSPVGPPNWEEFEEVVGSIDELPKPVWVHCEGGKDRTGGLIAGYMKKKSYTFNEIFAQFEEHKYPAWPWIAHLFACQCTHSLNSTFGGEEVKWEFILGAPPKEVKDGEEDN